MNATKTSKGHTRKAATTKGSLPALVVIRNGEKAGQFPPKRGMRLRNDFEILQIKRNGLTTYRPDKGMKLVSPGTRDYATTYREAHRFGFTPGRKRATKKAA